MNTLFKDRIPTKSEELLMASVELQTACEKIQSARDCLIGHHDEFRDQLLSLIVQVHKIQDQIEVDYRVLRSKDHGTR